MRRLRLVLLGGTAIFNLLFWLLLGDRYQLKGFLLGYPYTVLVGSVALGSLACLSASVRQTLPPLPARSLNWRSRWPARLLLVLLALGGWILAVLLRFPLSTVVPVLVPGYLLAVLLPYVLWPDQSLLVLLLLGAWTLAVSLGGLVLGLLLSLPWSYLFYLLTVLPAAVGSVFLFWGLVRILHATALPKPVTLLATILAGVSLVPALGAWVLLMVGEVPSCSQRFVSPSGQHILVLEQYDDWYEGGSFNNVYFKSGWWSRAIPSSLHEYDTCTDHSLRLRWSAGERQVDWQTVSEHGRWQW